MNTDLASVVVGAIAGIVATFGASWIWYVYGASPRERAERRRAKWERNAAKPFEGA